MKPILEALLTILMGIAFVALFGIMFSGCQAPCFMCSTPEAVSISLAGQVENLRVIETDIVDLLDDGELKAKWKLRLAAFITESRGTLAWATKEDFDALTVLEEERKE